MELREYLQQCPVIAILRGIRPEEAEPVCAVLEDAGISILEIPLNSPDPFRSISAVSSRFGDRMLVGAGTVTQPDQISGILAAGGRFVVMPHADVSIVRAAKSAGLFAIPGFFTPTEAIANLNAGADAIKLFPAEIVGPPMLKALKPVLPPDTLVVPVGGIDCESIGSWITAGAEALGAGSAIYRPGDSPSVVGSRVRLLMAAVTKAGPSDLQVLGA